MNNSIFVKFKKKINAGGPLCWMPVALMSILLVNLLAGSPLYAGSKTIDLNECVKIALQNHPGILESEEEKKEDVATYQSAKAQRGLKVDAQLKTVERLKSDSSSDDSVRIPGKDTNIGLFAGLYSYYNLYDAQKKKKEEAARTELAASKIDTDKVRDEIVFNVKKAYFEYLLAQDNLELRRRLMDKAKEKQVLTQKLYNNGLQPILDVTKANVALAQAMLNFEKARNEERSRKNSLYISMGVKERKDLVVVPVDKQNLPALKYNVEELNKLAELHNPDLRIIGLKKRISKLNIEIQKAQREPSVLITLGLGFENEALYLFNNGEGDFSDNFKTKNWGPVVTGTITASLPVYYGGGISAQIDKSVAQYNKLVYQERSVTLNMRSSIENTFEEISELKKQLHMSQLIIENSEKHALLAQRSYENGEGSLLALQNAEEGVLDAELGYLSSVYKYYLALATMSYTLGVEEGRLCLK